MRDWVDSLLKTRVQGFKSIELINLKPLKTLKRNGFSSKETSAKKNMQRFSVLLTPDLSVRTQFK